MSFAKSVGGLACTSRFEFSHTRTQSRHAVSHLDFHSLVYFLLFYFRQRFSTTPTSTSLTPAFSPHLIPEFQSTHCYNSNTHKPDLPTRRWRSVYMNSCSAPYPTHCTLRSCRRSGSLPTDQFQLPPRNETTRIEKEDARPQVCEQLCTSFATNSILCDPKGPPTTWSNPTSAEPAKDWQVVSKKLSCR